MLVPFRAICIYKYSDLGKKRKQSRMNVLAESHNKVCCCMLNELQVAGQFYRTRRESQALHLRKARVIIARSIHDK